MSEQIQILWGIGSLVAGAVSAYLIYMSHLKEGRSMALRRMTARLPWIAFGLSAMLSVVDLTVADTILLRSITGVYTFALPVLVIAWIIARYTITPEKDSRRFVGYLPDYLEFSFKRVLASSIRGDFTIAASIFLVLTAASCVAGISETDAYGKASGFGNLYGVFALLGIGLGIAANILGTKINAFRLNAAAWKSSYAPHFNSDQITTLTRTWEGRDPVDFPAFAENETHFAITDQEQSRVIIFRKTNLQRVRMSANALVLDWVDGGFQTLSGGDVANANMAERLLKIVREVAPIDEATTENTDDTSEPEPETDPLFD